MSFQSQSVTHWAERYPSGAGDGVSIAVRRMAFERGHALPNLIATAQRSPTGLPRLTWGDCPSRWSKSIDLLSAELG